jgi:hypothetical protein
MEGETMRARDILRAEYGSEKNLMTPTVLDVGSVVRGRVAYEISRGTGMRRQPIFGVSIASYDPDLNTTRRYANDISDCFGSLDAARDHVNFLRENWHLGENVLMLRLKVKKDGG